MQINIKHITKRIINTIILTVLLGLVLGYVVNYIYKIEEKNSFEYLHLETKQLKDEITLQIISDRENLTTMAHFAEKLYRDGESFDMLFESFKPIGLIDNIEILTQDNVLMTKGGQSMVGDNISYEDEVKKSVYVSGRVPDMNISEKEVVRSAVPIIVNHETVAMLYGVMRLDTLREQYIDRAEELQAQLYVFDSVSGDFIIDTFNRTLGNFRSLEDRQYKRGFSYERMSEDIKGKKSGFSVFISKATGKNLYVHYSPMEIESWVIMMGQPEENVFSNAQYVMHIMFTVCGLVVVIMTAYMIVVFNEERKRAKFNTCASSVRKLLLEINYRENSVKEALKVVVKYVKSKATFLLNTDGDQYQYIVDDSCKWLLDHDKKEVVLSELFKYTRKRHEDDNTAIHVMELAVDSKLENTFPTLHQLLKKYAVKNLSIVSVMDNHEHITLFGVVDSKRRKGAQKLMAEVAVCFSIAIYNRRYLLKTERAVVTDALTGLLNRVAYKKDIILLKEKRLEQLVCIYIDVNELHLFNNRYGHTAGDGMLTSIAEAIKETFGERYVYRMGGDEFLIFVENSSKEEIQTKVENLSQKVESMNYNISLGVAFESNTTEIEKLVKHAEKKMYESKARYYQNKQKKNIVEFTMDNPKHIATGMKELDTLLSVMGQKYKGIYSVSLKTGKSKRILMSAYLKHEEEEENFNQVFAEYVNEMVDPDYHRAMLSLLDYDILIKQVAVGNTVSITYRKISGDLVMLSIYAVENTGINEMETLWVFESTVE